jgi:hypothetical protein
VTWPNLADAFKARRHLWAFCKECGHATLMNPRNLIGKLGEMLFEECNPGFAARLTRSGRAARYRPAVAAFAEPVVDRAPEILS